MDNRQFPTPGSVMPRRRPPLINDYYQHKNAQYILDAGVGFAFAAVNEFPKLVNHYSGRLHVTETVVAEWRARSDSDGFDEKTRVLNRAARYLVSTGKNLDGLTIHSINDSGLIRIAELQESVKSIPPPDDHDFNPNANLGECSGVWLAEALREENPQVHILCANDHKAGILAQRSAVATRTSAHILREMVHMGVYTADIALDLFKEMCQISNVNSLVHQKFRSAQDFSRKP